MLFTAMAAPFIPSIHRGFGYRARALVSAGFYMIVGFGMFLCYDKRHMCAREDLRVAREKRHGFVRRY